MRVWVRKMSCENWKRMQFHHVSLPITKINCLLAIFSRQKELRYGLQDSRLWMYKLCIIPRAWTFDGKVTPVIRYSFKVLSPKSDCAILKKESNVRQIWSYRDSPFGHVDWEGLWQWMWVILRSKGHPWPCSQRK